MSDTHRLVVDRFEGELAVVEVDGERFLDLPRWMLPSDAKEDDVIVISRAPSEDPARAALDFRIDPDATATARAEARRLVDRLRRKDPGGDVTL